MSKRTGKIRNRYKTGPCKSAGVDENMNEFEMEGEGLLARAFCHELDHLDGKLYVELAEDGLHEVSYDEEDQDDAQGGEE